MENKVEKITKCTTAKLLLRYHGKNISHYERHRETRKH